MNLEFSIDKKTGAAIAACVVLASVLLVLAGYLLGASSALPASVASAVPAVTPAQKAQPRPGANPANAAPSAAGAADAASDADAAPAQTAAAGQPPAPSHYCLQFGSFRDKKNAQTLVKTLKKTGVTATVVVFSGANGQPWYVVRSGDFDSIDAASASAASMRSSQNLAVLVRRTGRL
jgi:septal ring-binding cell division protein DamX